MDCNHGMENGINGYCTQWHQTRVSSTLHSRLSYLLLLSHCRGFVSKSSVVSVLPFWSKIVNIDQKKKGTKNRDLWYSRNNRGRQRRFTINHNRLGTTHDIHWPSAVCGHWSQDSTISLAEASEGHCQRLSNSQRTQHILLGHIQGQKAIPHQKQSSNSWATKMKSPLWIWQQVMVVQVFVHEAIDVFLQQFTEKASEGARSVISRIRWLWSWLRYISAIMASCSSQEFYPDGWIY